MVKRLPALHPEAAPAADCSSICSLHLFFFFFLFPPLLILNVILETVVLGLVLPGVCALENICPGPENFQSAWIP